MAGGRSWLIFRRWRGLAVREVGHTGGQAGTLSHELRRGCSGIVPSGENTENPGSRSSSLISMGGCSSFPITRCSSLSWLDYLIFFFFFMDCGSTTIRSLSPWSVKGGFYVSDRLWHRIYQYCNRNSQKPLTRLISFWSISLFFFLPLPHSPFSRAMTGRGR